MKLARALLSALSMLCLLATPACDKDVAPSPVPGGHFRLQATTELSQSHLQSMADSWGILVNDVVRKPVAVQLKVWLPCDASVGLSFEGPLPSGWQGGVIDGTVKVCVGRVAAERNSTQPDAVVEIVGLIDYHYRTPKPFPVLLIRRLGQPGNNASVTWSKAELQDIEKETPFFRLVPVEDGVHRFGAQLEIAKFMGKPVFLSVGTLD